MTVAASHIRPRFFGALTALTATLALVPTTPASARGDCPRGRASDSHVGRPTATVAWRAVLVARTPLYARPFAGRGAAGPTGTVTPGQAEALLVLAARTDRRGRCWLKVRLPTRPNQAAAWTPAGRVEARPTPWRIVVSRGRRTLEVYRAGRRVSSTRVVVGAPGTPTPAGLFSIVGAWRSDPADFLGAWILALTAHSDVLQEFGNGDGRVGIHGRGGASLLDPLGSARSHGCVRVSNGPIAALVRTIGRDELTGIPIRMR